MNKIKAICDKYDISHRQLGILMGYHTATIQKINTGKYSLTPHFEILLDSIEKGLANGDIKIPD